MRKTGRKIRLIVHQEVTRSAGNGGSSYMGTGGATQQWVDENYVSHAFFSFLFVVHAIKTVTVTDENDDPVGNPVVTNITLTPNELPGTTVEEDTPSTGYTTTTVITLASIEATTNFWSSLAISALGHGSGGGGGAVALADLVDVAISNPTNGQVLMYNSTTQKWYNGTVQSGGGSVTSITAGTGLSGGTITSSGTIAISTAYQEYINEGRTAYGWGNHANAGYLTGITSQMVINALGYTPVSNATTWWGRSVSNNVVAGHIDMDNGDAVRFKANGGDGAYWNCLTMNSGNTLSLGYYIRTHNQSLKLEGGTIHFYVNQNSGSATTPSDNSLEAAYFSTNGLLTLNRGLYTPGVFTNADNYTGIRIGGAMLSWDSNNNALKVHAYDSANGSVDFYSTGGVSALGQSSGGGGGGTSSTLAQSYTLPYTTNSGSTRYWHKLGTYQMDSEAMNLVIDIFTGQGYNGGANQNVWARIIIKKSNTTSGTSGAVGITCDQFGYPMNNANDQFSGKILVRVNASAYNKGDVWVKCPWGYPKGAYTIQGNFTSWEHNNSTTGDTTAAPTHNQNAVGYYDNTSSMTSGE